MITLTQKKKILKTSNQQITGKLTKFKKGTKWNKVITKHTNVNTNQQNICRQWI